MSRLFLHLALLATVTLSGNAIANDGSLLPQQQATSELELQDDAIEKTKQQLNDAADQQQKQALQQQLTEQEQYRKEWVQQQGIPLFDLLGGPAYTPEMGLLVAVGGLYSFSTDRNDPTLQRSNVGAFVVANQGDGDAGMAVRTAYNLFFDQDRLRFSGNLRAGKQSEHFWGVGNDAGKAQDSSDDTLINALSIDYRGTVGFRIADNLYLGPVLRLNYYDPDSDELPLTADDANFVQYVDSPLSVGAGISLQYDSRDVAVNAWSGQYFNFEYVAYRDGIGSDLEFDQATIEHRYYHSIAEGRVVAVLNQFNWSDGDVPYYAMAKLGGMKSMRGLYMGRFRDENSAEHTLEYRHTFRHSNGSLSKHGMTLWGSLGSVAASVSDLYRDTLHTGGVGYRYEIQPRMNVRLDVGFSEYDRGLYFNFTEAF